MDYLDLRMQLSAAASREDWLGCRDAALDLLYFQEWEAEEKEMWERKVKRYQDLLDRTRPGR